MQLHLENLTFQNQVAVLTFIATFFLVSKTILSVLLTRRSLYFLSAKSSQAATAIVEKLLSQSILEIQKRPTQSLAHAVNGGVNSLFLSVLGVSTLVISDLALLGVLAVGLFILSPLIAATSLIFFLIIGIVLYGLMHKRAERIGIEDARLSIKANQQILEVLSSYRELMVRNRRSYYSANLRNTHSALTRVLAERTFMPNISKYVIEVAVIVGAVGISAVQFFFLDASNAVATLAVFMAAGSRIAPAALRIQQGLLQIRTSMGVGSETLELISELENLPRLDSEEKAFTFSHFGFSPSIVFKDVYANYPNANDHVLKGVSFEISPGESVAIVGPSGSGKSSLVDVLLGVIPVSSGAVIISNSTAAEVIKDYPGAIGYVPQDVLLVDRSIRENICLGFDTSEVNDAALNFAVNGAALGEFLTIFENGLDTIVGERGSSLSGGQRQRIGIARALVTMPSLLILDEATSSLDGVSEHEITESLLALKGRCTVVVIAHRLSSIRNFDRVIYLESGAIKAVGSFEDVRRLVPEFDNQAKLMGL
jgi:ABC-type multidrug transport system fused ATPase/permease subunit